MSPSSRHIAFCISNVIGTLFVVQASSLQSSIWQAGCLPHFRRSCITYAEGYNAAERGRQRRAPEGGTRAALTKGKDAMNRSADWRDQAKTDLEHARKSMVMGEFDWACFAAQHPALPPHGLGRQRRRLPLHRGRGPPGHRGRLGRRPHRPRRRPDPLRCAGYPHSLRRPTRGTDMNRRVVKC